MIYQNTDKQGEEQMNIFEALQRLASNDLLNLSDELFKLGPEYKPRLLTSEVINNEPLSFIIGKDPSNYALSPQMWNAEYRLRNRTLGLFLPFDIPEAKARNLEKLFELALVAGSKNFRVLTITNPYKVLAIQVLQVLAEKFPGKFDISNDARLIGATNQVLVGPDDVIYVTNSDGQGMANAIESFLALRGEGDLAGKNVGVVGSGGAARGIVHELAKRISRQAGGKLTVFNRTIENAETLVKAFSLYFPHLSLEAQPLTALTELAVTKDLLVSSITSGDPLFDLGVYPLLKPGALIVDANYDDKSLLEANARAMGRNDLDIHDGRGMVVEGYIVPSQRMAKLWDYKVPGNVYSTIGEMFGYNPRISI